MYLSETLNVFNKSVKLSSYGCQRLYEGRCPCDTVPCAPSYIRLLPTHCAVVGRGNVELWRQLELYCPVTLGCQICNLTSAAAHVTILLQL